MDLVQNRTPADTKQAANAERANRSCKSRLLRIDPERDFLESWGLRPIASLEKKEVEFHLRKSSFSVQSRNIPIDERNPEIEAITNG